MKNLRERIEEILRTWPEENYKEAADQILQVVEEMLPAELKSGDNVLLPKHIEEKTDGIYAYTLGFVEGVNLYLAQIRERIGEK